ncbi:MAG TPA: hypothetical protein V6C58_23190 [Allocoleopsis sp.]
MSNKPLRIGLKYGAMKANKGGCMACGNMEHSGCMCHMLGAGKNKKGGFLDKENQNLLNAFANQENPVNKYTGMTKEELAKVPLEERRKLKKEAMKKEYENRLRLASEEVQNEMKQEEINKRIQKKLRGGKVDKELVKEKKAMLEEVQKGNKEFKKAYEARIKQLDEEARKEEEAEHNKKSWLDKAFDFATDKLEDLVDMGLSEIGVPKGMTKKGLKALENKLREGGIVATKQQLKKNAEKAFKEGNMTKEEYDNFMNWASSYGGIVQTTQEKRKNIEKMYNDGQISEKDRDMLLFYLNSKGGSIFSAKPDYTHNENPKRMKDKLKELGFNLGGKKRVLSEAQKEYQQALELLKKKYNLNHKQAMMKYKEMKNKI